MAGFDIVATPGTAAYMRHHGLNIAAINKVHQGGKHILEAMERGEIALVFNTVYGGKSVYDSYSLRHAALMRSIPYYTTLPGINAAIEALTEQMRGELEVQSLQAYFSTRA